MKKLLFLLLLFISIHSFSQKFDTIVLKNGTKIPCSIVLEGDVQIEFYEVQPTGLLSKKKDKLNFNKIENIVYYVEPLEYSDTININPEKRNQIFEIICNWLVDTNDVYSTRIDIQKQGIKKLVTYDKVSGEIKGTFEVPYISGFTTFEAVRVNGIISFNGTFNLSENHCICHFSNYIHNGNKYAPGGAISFKKLAKRIWGRYNFEESSRKWFIEEWGYVKEMAINSTKRELKGLSGKIEFQK